MTFSRFRDVEKEKEESKAKLKQMDDERIEEVLWKTDVDPKVLPVPILSQFTTFEKLAKDIQDPRKGEFAEENIGVQSRTKDSAFKQRKMAD